MNQLKVPYAAISAHEAELSNLFEELPFHSIDQVSWNSYPYQPLVFFKIAYSDEAILLKYEVEEKYLRINSFQSNDPVYEDSCVEFFISFQEGLYYNLEFNPLGIALVGYGGADKSTRERLPGTLIEKIKSFSNIQSTVEQEGVKWNLSLYIPFEIFYKEEIQAIGGYKASANFYKCGDLLPEPHFVSWKRIEAPEPNFHLPEFFEEIEFE